MGTELNNFTELIEFSQHVILDHMESLYNTYSLYINNKFFPIAIYKLLVSSIMEYYNLVFRSLIVKDDTELINRFQNLTSLYKHKAICLINILFQLSLSFLHHVMEDHHKFNKESLQDYISDIHDCMTNNINEKKEKIAENIKHECNGLNLDECDSDKPLFSLKEK